MSLRRSTRLRTTKAVPEAPAGEDSDNASDIDATEWTTTTGRKRRRTAARKPVKTHGCRPVITEIPLDILREILSHVDPCDLIALSRVSKIFQTTLVSKSNAFLWRDAVKSEGMPSCPSDINEYHYLNSVADCNPAPRCFFVTSSNEKTFAKPAVQMRIFDNFYRNPATAFYPRIQIKSSRRYFRTRVHKGMMQALDAEYNSITGDESKKAWRVAKQATHTEIHKLRPLLEKWLKEKEEEREIMLKNLRESRYQAILAKIREAGKTAELELMSEEEYDAFKKLKGVSQPQSLDEQEWGQIKSPIFDFLEDIMKTRAEEFVQDAIQRLLPHFRDAFLEFIPDTPYDPYMPAWTDLCLTASTGIISKAALLLDDSVAKEHFSSLLRANDDEFRSLVANWRSGIDENLLDLLKRVNPSTALVDLSDPNNVFSCGRCEKLMQYPQVVAHRCETMIEKFGLKTYGCNFTTWKNQPFVFEADLSQAVVAATQNLGLTILAEDTVEFTLFDCPSCSEASGRRVLRSWNEMLTDRASCIEQGHKVVRATLTQEEKKLKDLYIDLQFARSPDPVLVCAACRALLRGCADGPESLLEHKATCHGENNHKVWREGVDFHRHPEAASSITFKDGFILREGVDVRDIIAGAWNNSSGTGKRIPDLRTYSCLDPGTSKILRDLYIEI